MSVQAISSNSTLSQSAAQSTKSGMANPDVTFLNLLITELKSQDPTAPMDGTQMVGQMVSLNQLDQLIGIRQILQSTMDTASKVSQAPAKGEN